MTPITIDLPDNVVEKLNDYLKQHPEETMADIIKEALRIRAPKKLDGLIALASTVQDLPKVADASAGDYCF